MAIKIKVDKTKAREFLDSLNWGESMLLFNISNGGPLYPAHKGRGTTHTRLKSIRAKWEETHGETDRDPLILAMLDCLKWRG